MRYGCYNKSTTREKGMQYVQSSYKNDSICEYCGFGSYSYSREQPCQKCSTNYYDQCYANQTFLKQNYWRDSQNESNYGTNSVQYCRLNKQSCFSDNRAGFGNAYCAEGHIGSQCLACDNKGEYWKGEQYGQLGLFSCAKCSSLKKNNIFIYFSLFSIFFLMTLTLFSSYKRMKNQVLRVYISYYMKLVYNGSSFIRQSQASVYIKILLFNLQIYMITYYFVEFNKYYSSLHSAIYSLFNPLQSSAGISFDCFLLSYFPDEDSIGYVKLIVIVVEPLLINLFIGMVLFILFLVKKKSYFYILIQSIAYTVIFLFQSQIIQLSIESLLCIELDNNNQFLQIDTKINCSDSSWLSKMRSLSIPSILIYILLIPILLLISLWKNRKTLEKKKTIFYFGFLYDEYKRKYFYWQFVKAILSALLSVFNAIGKAQFLLFSLIYCGVLTVYGVVIIIVMSFQQKRLNQIEANSILFSVLYLLSSLSLEVNYQNPDQYNSVAFGSILANVFYYLILACQGVFYLFMTVLIITSLFQLSIQKLQRFSLFQKLILFFPSILSKVYSRQLRINYKKWRSVAKAIQSKNIQLEQKYLLDENNNGMLEDEIDNLAESCINQNNYILNDQI
ncbi:hypothetical protein ABPG72_003888 [Tetrahymena utriculariae]